MKKHTILSVGLLLFCYTQSLSQELEFDSVPENLGPNINSPFIEIGPVISPNGKILFFDRKYHPGNTGGTLDGDDIWYSTFQDDSNWTEAQNIKAPLNTNGFNFIQSILPDGNTILLITINKYTRKNSSHGISISHRIKEGWSLPQKQKIKKYKNRNNYEAYCLSADGKVLLLSVETKTGLGLRDLYVSFRITENKWGQPKNLGPTINTKQNDGSPFLAADGVTLYFSTSGLQGHGDEDIFMSRRLDDSWTNWTKPVNMGPKINSDGWDTFFTIPASGDYAYFVSSKNGFGETDIFRIKMPTEAKPDPVVLVSGKVLNIKTNDPIESTILYEILPDGKEAGTARSDPEDGKYSIVLPYGNTYGFMAQAQGYYPINENLDVSDLTEYTEIKKDLFLAPIEVGQVIRLNNIFFEFGKAELKKASFPELNRVVTFLKENPTVEIQISGHTDNIGSDHSNLLLSQNRAEAVMNYISEKGIDKDRMKAKGYGENNPIANNENEEGRSLNRRVEFTILK